MKILHTADWHIGKLVHKIHMTEDQKYILEQLVTFIKESKPDVLIIAGDIYDRSIPPTEAVELLDSTLTSILSDTNTKIIIISGNHDNPERLKFGSSILKKQGLHIATKIQHIFKPIIIEDEDGPVNFYTIPFIEPEIVRDYFDDENIKSHDDAIKKITDELKIDTSARNVCISHGYISSGSEMEECESEKPITIGGTSAVESNHFKEFDYVALGHLHGPQIVGDNNIRYCGSLLKYSFSEVNQNKGILLVDINKKEVAITKETFVPLRDFRIIKGELNDLLKEETYSIGNREDYIKAVLTDNGEILSPFSKIQSIYPNLISLEFQRDEEADKSTETGESGKSILQEDPLDLFEKFYKAVGKDDLENEEKTILKDVYKTISKEERCS